MKKEFLNVGEIVGTHGVKGMVKIYPYADTPQFLTKFKKFYIDDNKKELTALKVAVNGKMVIAAIDGINTIPEAETLRGKALFVKRDDAPLKKGRYFIDEIIGADVFDSQSGNLLGKLTDVFSTGANDVWQITDNGKDYLLPAVDEVIVSVDIETDKITVKPIKGIFDDED